MNLSIFEDDETLGRMAGTRVVVLRGTVTVSQLFSPNLFNVDRWMKTGLENRGFSVNAVRMSPAGWIGYTNAVEIELNVFNEYSAEQARSNAINAITDTTANFGLNSVFSNVTLSVVYDANPSAGVVPSPPSEYNLPPVGDGGFFSNLGKSLGVSAPIALVAGGLVVLVMLRR